MSFEGERLQASKAFAVNPSFTNFPFHLPDVRLKKFNEEKQELQVEVQKLQQQLNDVKTRGGRRSSSLNGVLDDDDFEDAQRKYFADNSQFALLLTFLSCFRRSE